MHNQLMAVYVNLFDQKVNANRKFSSYLWSPSPFLNIPSDKAILLTFELKISHLRALLGRHCTKYVHACGTVYCSYYHRS